MSGLQSKRRWPNRKKMATGIGALLLLVSIALLRRCAAASDIVETRAAVFELRSAAIRWQIDHGDSTCPNVKQLIEGKYLTSQTRLVDAWGQGFATTCFELTLGVASLGPDQKKGTPDDIVAPPVSVRQR